MKEVSPTLERLRVTLPKAGLTLLPEAYLARARRLAWAVLAAGMVVALLLLAVFWAQIRSLSAGAQVLLALLPLVAALIAYRFSLLWPELRAMLRSSRIEGKLPFAVNYLSTMASGGLTLERMFGQLATQHVYGPIAQEAAIVHRDLTLLGLDLVAALRGAIERSPSIKFQDFLQGLLTTLTSGGDLPLFLETKSDQYFTENRSQQGRFLEQLALIAEVFVVIVVAAPLLVLVLLSVLTLFGRSGPEVLLLGYATVVIVLPLSHVAFASTIRFLQPEA